MIVDHVANGATYARLAVGIATGLSFLAEASRPGFVRHSEQIDGGPVRAIFEAYETRNEDHLYFEAHDRFIDIQFVADGIERIQIAPRGSLVEYRPYDREADVALIAAATR